MKYFPFLIIGLTLTYCLSDKTVKQNIQDQIESYLKSKGHDVASYEFVSLTEPDTVTQKDYLDREMGGLTLSLMNKAIRMKKIDSIENVLNKELASNPGDSATMMNLKDLASSRATIVRQQHTMDSLTAAITPEMSQTIKFIGVTYSFNKKNDAGTKTLHKYYIKLDGTLHVIDVTELTN